MRRRFIRFTFIEKDILQSLASRGPESIELLFRGHPQAPDGSRSLRERIRLQSKLETFGLIAPSCQESRPDSVDRHRITDRGRSLVDRNRITMRISK